MNSVHLNYQLVQCNDRVVDLHRNSCYCNYLQNKCILRRPNPEKNDENILAVLGGYTGGESKQRKAKNGVDDNINITEWTGMR